jgi:hypothetical protein
MRLASGISNLGFNLVQHLEKDRENEEYESEEYESKSDSENEKARKSEGEHKNESGDESSKNGSDEEKEENEAMKSSSDISPDEYPLLHKLGIHSEFMDELMQELVRYHGQNTIEYMQGNNCPGYLVPLPSLCTIKSYESTITAKSDSFIDSIAHNIAKSASCSESDAIVCLL